ncbi:hypothetical protein O982_05480 [Mycobacterium avium 10-5581]|nr:hypothetical protein O982_05480 [Mycobacterium avium 10-5581]
MSCGPWRPGWGWAGSASPTAGIWPRRCVRSPDAATRRASSPGGVRLPVACRSGAAKQRSRPTPPRPALGILPARPRQVRQVHR